MILQLIGANYYIPPSGNMLWLSFFLATYRDLPFFRQSYAFLLQVQLLDSLLHPLQTPFSIGLPHVLHGVHPQA